MNNLVILLFLFLLSFAHCIVTLFTIVNLSEKPLLFPTYAITIYGMVVLFWFLYIICFCFVRSYKKILIDFLIDFEEINKMDVYVKGSNG